MMGNGMMHGMHWGMGWMMLCVFLGVILLIGIILLILWAIKIPGKNRTGKAEETALDISVISGSDQGNLLIWLQ